MHQVVSFDGKTELDFWESEECNRWKYCNHLIVNIVKILQPPNFGNIVKILQPRSIEKILQPPNFENIATTTTKFCHLFVPQPIINIQPHTALNSRFANIQCFSPNPSISALKWNLKWLKCIKTSSVDKISSNVSKSAQLSKQRYCPGSRVQMAVFSTLMFKRTKLCSSSTRFTFHW